MPVHSKDGERDSGRDAEREKASRSFASQTAIAMELPFTIVGATIVGGAAGYFLDHWLHTAPYLMLVIGGLGFAGGLREVLHRLAQTDGSSGSASGGSRKPGDSGSNSK
jgi:F0F1-type ATP synthase assembly protein I